MNCPNCLAVIGHHVEAFTGTVHNPQEGDIGLCFACGQQMISTGERMESLEDKSFLSWFERVQLSIMHWEWSWGKNGFHGN